MKIENKKYAQAYPSEVARKNWIPFLIIFSFYKMIFSSLHKKMGAIRGIMYHLHNYLKFLGAETMDLVSFPQSVTHLPYQRKALMLLIYDLKAVYNTCSKEGWMGYNMLAACLSVAGFLGAYFIVTCDQKIEKEKKLAGEWYVQTSARWNYSLAFGVAILFTFFLIYLKPGP